jgi:hypothetical protein
MRSSKEQAEVILRKVELKLAARRRKIIVTTTSVTAAACVAFAIFTSLLKSPAPPPDSHLQATIPVADATEGGSVALEPKNPYENTAPPKSPENTNESTALPINPQNTVPPATMPTVPNTPNIPYIPPSENPSVLPPSDNLNNDVDEAPQETKYLAATKKVGYLYLDEKIYIQDGIKRYTFESEFVAANNYFMSDFCGMANGRIALTLTDGVEFANAAAYLSSESDICIAYKLEDDWLIVMYRAVTKN